MTAQAAQQSSAGQAPVAAELAWTRSVDRGQYASNWLSQIPGVSAGGSVSARGERPPVESSWHDAASWATRITDARTPPGSSQRTSGTGSAGQAHGGAATAAPPAARAAAQCEEARSVEVQTAPVDAAAIRQSLRDASRAVSAVVSGPGAVRAAEQRVSASARQSGPSDGGAAGGSRSSGEHASLIYNSAGTSGDMELRLLNMPAQASS